jgi:hypothetical protein
LHVDNNDRLWKSWRTGLRPRWKQVGRVVSVKEISRLPSSICCVPYTCSKDSDHAHHTSHDGIMAQTAACSERREKNLSSVLLEAFRSNLREADNINEVPSNLVLENWWRLEMRLGDEVGGGVMPCRTGLR